MNPGDGAVTALAFHQAAEGAAPSHLLNGSSDGSISVWQVGREDAMSGSFIAQHAVCRPSVGTCSKRCCLDPQEAKHCPATPGLAASLQGGSWDCLKTMEGHKGAVNSLSVHPNGSVALSVGRCSLTFLLRTSTCRSALLICLDLAQPGLHAHAPSRVMIFTSM